MYNLLLSFWALEISSLNESSKRVLGLKQLIKTVLDFPPCRHVPPLQRSRQGIPTVLWAQLLVTAKQQSSNVWSDNWPHSQHTTTRPLGTIPTCRIHYNVFLATIIEGTSLSNTESCHKPALHQCSPQLSRTRRSLCSVLQEGKMRLLSMKTRWRRKRMEVECNNNNNIMKNSKGPRMPCNICADTALFSEEELRPHLKAHYDVIVMFKCGVCR